MNQQLSNPTTSDNKVTLTKQEATLFLRNVLKITNPEEEQRTKSNLDFLRLIIRQWYEFIPFQNIHQLYLSKTEHRLPAVEEIISLLMAGKGGVCIHLAVFCHLLLQALGYNVHLSLATISKPFDHAIVIGKNIEQIGDKYLIDVGNGYPTFEPVLIESIGDFDNTNAVYNHMALEYKYVKEEDRIVRYHRAGDTLLRKGDFVYKDGWRKHSEIQSLKPVEVSYLYSEEAGILRTLVPTMPISLLMRIVCAVRYTKEFCYGIKKGVLSITDVEGNRKSTDLDGVEEITRRFEEFFPMIGDFELVAEACEFAQCNLEKWPEGLE